jgi:hypothetical protein
MIVLVLLILMSVALTRLGLVTVGREAGQPPSS